MSILSYVIWSADPEIFQFPEWLPLIGDRPVRWYGLLFALGFLISQQVMFYIYRKEGKPEKDVETLTVFMVIATIIGARLGHVLFYEPEKYLSNPIDIIKIWEGGLASHGAAFGILFALWLYTRYDIKLKYFRIVKGFGLPYGFKSTRVKRPGQNWYQVVDRIVIVVALTGCLIRFGNFMNSEIYGKPTDSTYGVVFVNNLKEIFDGPASPVEEISFSHGGDKKMDNGHVPVHLSIDLKNHPDLRSEKTVRSYMDGTFKRVLSSNTYIKDHIYQDPSKELDYSLSQNNNGTFHAEVDTYGISRHPTQLYESFTSLLIGVILFLIWNVKKQKTAPGLLLGIFLIVLFGLRFVHELFKENQVSFEDSMSINMGQILSIPLILAGVFILLRAIKHEPIEE